VSGDSSEGAEAGAAAEPARRAGTGSDPVEAIVVAAGSSRRMGGRNKLAEELRGRSVLRWSVDALGGAGIERIVIVTSPDRLAEIAAEPWLPDSVVAVVAGGERRQESVAAGVAALADPLTPPAPTRDARATGRRPAADTAAAPHAARATDPILLVHDAARPLASPGLVRAVAEATARHGAAIPVVPITETLKRLDGDRVGVTVDRSGVVAAQTPQGVRRSLLERAYAQYPPDGAETWTDEASLLEACRIPVHAISGEATNLKVTVPVDLDRAGAFLDGGLVPGRPAASAVASAPAHLGAAAAIAPAGRIGLGIDGHPFGAGEPLVLGGLRIDGAPRLSGHSDGDAALHAVADALLGAAGLGDLGRLFPADDRTPAGIDSRVLLATVADRVRAAGWVTANVDLTIIAARPRLAALLPAMGAAIATTLRIDGSAVNVKASTGNLGGAEGAGRSISASAIVLLEPAAATSTRAVRARGRAPGAHQVEAGG
jgi:2-C-methyl-D-erythritol 4-phosphate cytidylyltransferase/2-C-methyl-D-erythritol 2,4-cyclodiphosphate synthase